MSHTPAPWEIRRGHSPHVKEIVGPKREAICATHNWLASDPIEESAANAHLIAAAPELLEALEGIMNSIGGGKKQCGHDFDCVCASDKARAVIAKVKHEY